MNDSSPVALHAPDLDVLARAHFAGKVAHRAYLPDEAIDP